MNRILAGLMAVVVTGSLAAGGTMSADKKKDLPLRGMPDAVLKSPQNSKYATGRVIVKIHAGVQQTSPNGTSGVASIDNFVQRYGASSLHPLFAHHPLTTLKKGEVDLTKFYELRFSAPIDPFTIARELSQLPEVEYAEPMFIYPVSEQTAFTPNDSLLGHQWALAKIKADSAWSVNQGDTSIVIGIIDTGVQWTHPDLVGNIWTNPGESGLDIDGHDKRTNGIDDDHNGYIDDWHGWDFMGADYNNPIEDSDPSPQGPNALNLAHGTHVSGIASASTNNTSGIAGIGFKCRILPIKTTADNDGPARGGPYIDRGFEGIVYAADMGAKVINCSWGGGGASQFEQDVINYATQHGALVVAAAGNSSTTFVQYPAGYANVISVAATIGTDQLTTYSTHNELVDVCAPGGDGSSASTLILSTWYPNTYAYLSGTSMASPLVAGLAGLVASQFPSYTPLQVGEQVRVTCDNIYGINSSYLYELGKGRINALKALTVSSPSLRMTSYSISDSVGGNDNGALEPNETFTLTTSFYNYLQTTSSNATITLTTSDGYLSIVNGSFPIGTVGTNGSANNSASPFQVHVQSNAPAAHTARMVLQISDGSYSDFQVINLLLNPTFATMNVNNVHVTLTNNGRIGFNDYFNNTEGEGFVYGSVNQLFEGGVIIGYSATKLVDVVRDSTQGAEDADFSSSQIYNVQTPGTISAQDGSAIFTDAPASATNKIGIQVNEYSYAFTSAPDSDYVIARYDIKNTGGSTLSNVYAGLFFDWDMTAPEQSDPNYFDHNKTSFDNTRDLGYAWYDTNITTTYCGVRALNGAAGYRGLLNSASIPLGRSDKWSWLSGGIVLESSTGDIHFAISSGPYTIAPNQSKMVAFALIGGRGLLNLQAHADAALSKWNEILPLLGVTEVGNGIPATYALNQNYPNPFNPVTDIVFDIPKASFVVLKVYDLLGREVATLVNGEQQAGTFSVPFDGSRLASGVYFYRLSARTSGTNSAPAFNDVKKLMLVR